MTIVTIAGEGVKKICEIVTFCDKEILGKIHFKFTQIHQENNIKWVQYDIKKN